MEKPIRALLLAAGLGTRLRPITLNTPKCLVKIKDQTLLENWLLKLEGLGIYSTLINTHYLSEKVDDFLKKRPKSKMEIKITYEKDLRGTAGTLINNNNFFNGYTGMMIHADNYTQSDLKEFIKFHFNRPKKCLLTMLTFDSKNPQKCGIVEIDINGVVINFHEKVSNPPGNRANGAVYLFDPNFLEWLTTYHPNSHDFSNDVIPHLVGSIATWHTTKPYIDIGTPESLQEARLI